RTRLPCGCSKATSATATRSASMRSTATSCSKRRRPAPRSPPEPISARPRRTFRQPRRGSDREAHMKKAALLAGALLAALVVTAVAASAPKDTMWAAKLTAAQEIPKQTVKDAKAKGAFTATLTGKKLKWRLTFSRLTG